MTIATAVQQGRTVVIYDERGTSVATIGIGQGSLQGYTSSSVSVRNGNVIDTYDDRGQYTGSISAIGS